MIGSIIAGASGLVGGISSMVGGIQQQKIQKDQLEYQKWLNQQQMNREDNSMQRRVSDLKLAGINPLLASGIGGAEAKGGQATAIPSESPLGTGMAQGAQTINQALQAQVSQAQIDKTKAETDNLKAQNPTIKKQESQLDEQINQIKSQTKNNYYEGVAKIDQRLGGLVETEMSKLGMGGEAGFKILGIGAGGNAKKETEKRIRQITYDIADRLYNNEITATQARELVTARLNDIKDEYEMKQITDRKAKRSPEKAKEREKNRYGYKLK